MIAMLTPDQIAENWDLIKVRVLKLPNTGEARVNHLLKKMLDGSFQCWMHTDQDEFKGALITSFIRDPILDEISLFVYAIFFWESLPLEILAEDFNVIKEFAKAHACKHVVSTSPIKKIVAMCKALGGDTSSTYIVFNLGE